MSLFPPISDQTLFAWPEDYFDNNLLPVHNDTVHMSDEQNEIIRLLEIPAAGFDIGMLE